MKKVNILTLDAVSIQVVGNKTLGEGISYASQLSHLGQSDEFLKEMIDKNFDFISKKHFTYIESIDLNPAYNFIKRIFNNRDSLLKQSNNLAAYLYEQSIHPNIKCGEFYVIVATCEYLGGVHECVILLKNEKKEQFLSFESKGAVINVKTNYGMGIKNLDKGCIVINKDEQSGYVVYTVDKTNYGADAHYWIESFLHVEDSKDDSYNNSLKMLSVCTSFVRELKKTEDDIEYAKIASTINDIFSSGISIDMQTLIEKTCHNNQHKELLEGLLRAAGADDESFPESIHSELNSIKRRSLTKLNTIKLGNDFELKILNPNGTIVTGKDDKTGMRFTKLFYK